MIIVTGGAGMIGSAFVWKLNEMGIKDILIVDKLRKEDKWLNIRKREYYDWMDKDNLKEKDGNKYIMCAGKYDRNGWTIVFKARNYKEAEYIIENTPLKAKKGCNVELFAKPHPIYC